MTTKNTTKSNQESLEQRRDKLAAHLFEQQLRTDAIKMDWLKEFVKIQSVISSTGIAGSFVILQQATASPPTTVRWALILFLIVLVLNSLAMFYVMNLYTNKGQEIWKRRSRSIYEAKNHDELSSLFGPINFKGKFSAMAVSSLCMAFGWLLMLGAIGLLLYHFW